MWISWKIVLSDQLKLFFNVKQNIFIFVAFEIHYGTIFSNLEEIKIISWI